METPHIQPPPRALHGPLPDADDPALYHATTQDYATPRKSPNESFVSIFGWITRRFKKRAHRPDVHRRTSVMARDSRGFSLLSPLTRRGNEKGPTAAPAEQSPSTEMTELQTHESATASPTAPPSHMSPDLKPAPDYAKMEDTSSGQSDDPLVGRLTKVKSFIREVNDLPWVSTDRVTIDYYPGKPKKRPQVQPRPPPQGPRHVRSWYSERTSGLLPFTAVPEGNDPSLLMPIPATPPPPAEPEDQPEGNNTAISDPQDNLQHSDSVPPT